MYDYTLFRLYDLFLARPTVCTDSRRVTEGAMFFALRGENFDGNRFAAQALDSGASCCVVDDPKAATDERCIVVKDVLHTLQALARHHRRKLGIPVLAVTGSNGKTTTKELVSRVLACRYRIGVTQGNLNNHIGVPLTLLSLNGSTQFGVVEMGANHPGEIAALCAIAEPDYGLITNIGKAHLEGFGGVEGIRRGKGELFDYLREKCGVAFYLKESEALSEMTAERPGLLTVPYSSSELELLPAADGEGGLALRCGGMEIRTSLVGDYNRDNVAAAMAVAGYFDIPAEKAVRAVESYVPDNGRSQRRETRDNVLYLDAYNANPTSMEAAIRNFARAGEGTREKVAVLGDMLELGRYAEAEHRRILKLAREAGIRRAFLVGEHFCAANDCPDFLGFATTEALRKHLSEHPLRGCAVLLKGSRGNRLEILEGVL